MKEQEIKLPEIHLDLLCAHWELWDAILDWRSKDRDAVSEAKRIDEIVKSMMNAHAREAVRMNQQCPEQASDERRPFDLEAAKRGDPMVTRDGRSAKFVAHVPDAAEDNRIVAFIEGFRAVVSFNENGHYTLSETDSIDLFMAPKPKRTVWVNFHGLGVAIYYQSESEAKESALQMSPIAIAVPVQIDA